MNFEKCETRKKIIKARISQTEYKINLPPISNRATNQN